MVALVALSLASECEPLGAGEFSSLLIDAETALDRSDRERLDTLVGELVRRVPCLEFGPSTRQVADFFVLVAVWRFARGEPWEDAISTAVDVRPNVDRGVSPHHPVGAYQPSPQPEQPAPLVATGPVWVDGSLVETLPGSGMHLVQRTADGVWRTVLMDGTPPDAVWFQERIRQPVTWTFGASAGVLVGALVVRQDRVGAWADGGSGRPAFPDVTWGLPVATLSLRGLADRGSVRVHGRIRADLLGLESATVRHAVGGVGVHLHDGFVLGIAGGLAAASYRFLGAEDVGYAIHHGTMPAGEVFGSLRFGVAELELAAFGAVGLFGATSSLSRPLGPAAREARPRLGAFLDVRRGVFGSLLAPGTDSSAGVAQLVVGVELTAALTGSP
ncbi:MAG: hypothetical protein KC656_20790 [Myxococcales bacterium]|nr:hypothetical protein [Myxococcales bacterium]MCB9671592.1 hypothetical protein [Alphaproteobacteria bacterium]MCB9694255.1 hypothetical protein [Alphaproteobacteria bacterium]